jgi:cytochrome c-type biogenesis protein
MLWLIAYAWRTVIKKVKRMANPYGMFKKILGIIVIVVGISILFKRDKTAETRLIENNLYFNTVNREYDRVKQFK